MVMMVVNLAKRGSRHVLTEAITIVVAPSSSLAGLDSRSMHALDFSLPFLEISLHKSKAIMSGDLL